MPISKHITPNKIWAMLRSDRGFHIISFIASFIILIFTIYMAIAISQKKFSKEYMEVWDTIFLIVALVTYLADTIGWIEKNPRAVNIARSATLVSIAIPLLSRAISNDFIIEHYKISFFFSFLLFLLCYGWIVRHTYMSINAKGEKTAKEEAHKVQTMKPDDKK